MATVVVNLYSMGQLAFVMSELMEGTKNWRLAIFDFLGTLLIDDLTMNLTTMIF